MNECAVCASKTEVVYRSDEGHAVTSLCTVLEQSTVVLACAECGHLQTPPIGALDAYYATAYRILLASEEEDQIYSVDGDRRVYRAEHQASTFLAKVEVPQAGRVLDFGAAKGATMRRVREARPDLGVHFFDVSDMYVDYWKSIVSDDAWATFERPATWLGSFDVVASFFMLEHVERPTEIVRQMFDLLLPGGSVFAVVPDPFVNIGDFVVVDHTNHFTAPSLERLFSAAGFEGVTVDDQAYIGAWCVTGRKPVGGDHAPVLSSDVQFQLRRAQELAEYWSSARAKVAEAESLVAGAPVAIYGAGFYGAFIRSSLAHPDAVTAYVDQNPHLQGTEHAGRSVVAPSDLADGVSEVLVGLNPIHARSIIEAIESWRGRNLRFHYL